MTDVAPGPVPGQERILALDAVRGLAVLGILAMNVVEFGLPMQAYVNPAWAGGAAGADRFTWLVQTALFDGKMRALFSMLFGAGLVLIDDRMQRTGRGAQAADLLLRRCLWLVPFGILHRFLLQWTGDILYVYGLLGLIAIAFRRQRARFTAIVGVLILACAVPVAFWHHHQSAAVRDEAAAAEALRESGEEVPAELENARRQWQRRVESIPPNPAVVQQEIDAIRGGYGSVFAHRWDHHHAFQSAFVYYYFAFDVLGMMLLGMALQRSGFFTGAWRVQSHVAWIGAGALAAAATWQWGLAWADTGFSPGAIGLRLVHDACHPFERVAGALAWASLLLLVVRAGRLRAAMRALANVGRMAFSNYVLQTVCCTLFFFGYGLGRYGSLSRAETMWVLLAVTIVQLVSSALWLRRFRFGPLEWAWRALTWWRAP